MSQYHHKNLPAALLEVAELILERNGISGLTLRAAAREAGVSHTAPVHHFGDLSGLISELAASGFIRLHDQIAVTLKNAGQSRLERLKALRRGYVGFAQAHPGLFQLMFRSERLDWNRPSLATAGATAFALLAQQGEGIEGDLPHASLSSVAGVMAQWSFAHGMAMLIIDGRFEAISTKMFNADVETVRDEVLKQFLIERQGL